MKRDETLHSPAKQTAAPASNMGQQAGELWPGWQTVRLIGKGSFGAVYEIRREMMGLKESAALKMITIPGREDEVSSLRSDGMDEQSITSYFQECVQDILKEYGFMKEVRGHTNIVNCDDFRAIRHSDGIGWDIYIKMELLTALPDKLRDGPLPEQEVIALGKDICRALMVCKSKNIVHRDIKPQNIFVSADGDYKLGDFGISMISDHTTFASTAGTYRYMAPEVYFNKPYGTKADLYSLGLVMYWLLNHRRGPFEPLPPKAVTKAALEKAKESRFLGEKLPSPATGSAQLHEIIRRACEFEAEDRYSGPQQMLQALEQMGQPFSDAQPEPSEQAEVARVPVSAQPKKKNRRGWAGAICAALVLAAAGFGIGKWLQMREPVPDSGETEPSSVQQQQQTQAEDRLEFDPETMYRITLTPGENMGVREYLDSLEVLRQRLDILTQGQRYDLQNQEDTATLILPRACIGTMDVEDVLRQYITRPMELYIIDVDSAGILPLRLSKVALSREDVKSVTRKEGRIEGVVPEEYDIPEEPYAYLEIALTEDYVQRCAEQIRQWTRLGLAQDISNDTWWYSDAFFREEENVLYVLNHDREIPGLELQMFNIRNAPLPDSFYYSVENSVVWEAVEEAFKPGQYQVDVSALEGKTVTVHYKSWNIPERESGDWIDAYLAVKRQLDALQMPYALGWTCRQGNYGLAVRTGVERMCPEFMRMMNESQDVVLRCGLKQESFYLTEGCRIVDNGDGTYSYEVDVSGAYDGQEGLTALTEGAGAQQELLLLAGDVPVLSAPAGAAEGGKVTFSAVYWDGSSITEEKLYLLQLLDLLFSQGGATNMTLDFYDFDPDGQGQKATEEDFGIVYEKETQAVRDAVRKFAPDAEVKPDGSTGIYVFLDLYVDESFPQTAAEMVKNIYQTLDFESMRCDSLAFILLDEDDEAQERGRIFFRKDYYQEKVNLDGVLRNGRLEKYRERFLKILAEDSFYGQLGSFEEHNW